MSRRSVYLDSILWSGIWIGGLATLGMVALVQAGFLWILYEAEPWVIRVVFAIGLFCCFWATWQYLRVTDRWP